MQDVFQALFKYRPFYFKHGELSFQWLPGTQWILVAGATALAFLVWCYWRGWLSRPEKRVWSLLLLRSVFFLFLGLILMRPVLTLSTVVPRENLLALLVDNSTSLGIVDGTGVRNEKIQPFIDPESEFLRRLDTNFVVKPYSFDSSPRAQSFPMHLDWSGTRTNLAAALEGILAENRNLPLAGIVLFSDGADNGYAALDPVLSELKASKISLYPVGVGDPVIDKDAEMTQVSVPRRVLKGATTVARISLRQSGFGGSRGRLEARAKSVLVATKEVHFPLDSETTTVEVSLVPDDTGLIEYEFRLLPLQGERIEQNNVRRTLLEVRNDKPRILYVEGRPRWEYKFIRRALDGDDSLHLETLLRTALNKFYRQGIEEETTLASGFPSDPETLFEYEGIILGDVESSFFRYSQMELIRDFVARRGGGFLMLGGSHSFGSGAYQNTPVESLLPVILPPQKESGFVRGFGKLVPTALGSDHPALKVGGGPEDRGDWKTMALLEDWNLALGAKPGTTVLARLGREGRPDGQAAPLLAFQRFGRGHSIAFLSGSSWRWQMMQDSADRRHEIFWKQLLYWLAGLARDRVEVQTERQAYSTGEMVEIRAEVRDQTFNEVNDALVSAEVALPDGGSEHVPLDWTAREEGVYVGRLQVGQPGQHVVSLDVQRRSGPTRQDAATTGFLVEDRNPEYFDAGQKVEFLKRLADQTGGRYYALSEASSLPEEIVYTQKTATTIENLDLWDMPANLLLLLALLTAEWVLRRRYGVL